MLLHTTTSIVFKRAFVFALSAIVGAASHIFWDGFTHNNTYFTNTLPFYRGTFIPFGGVRYPMFYVLQHISTIVGLVAVTIYLFRLKPSNEAHLVKPNLSYWGILLLITAITVALRFTIRSNDLELGNFVVTVISGLCLAVIICGLIDFKNSPATFRPEHG